jgi:hypothetical protein
LFPLALILDFIKLSRIRVVLKHSPASRKKFYTWFLLISLVDAIIFIIIIFLPQLTHVEYFDQLTTSALSLIAVHVGLQFEILDLLKHSVSKKALAKRAAAANKKKGKLPESLVTTLSTVPTKEKTGQQKSDDDAFSNIDFFDSSN